MTRSAWLTPDSIPASLACRALFFPDDVAWQAIVAGALDELTKPYNFEIYGSVTPEEAATQFQEMFDKWSFNEGFCRMIGEIIWYAVDTNPDTNHWLHCDGSVVDKADFPDLYALIGTVYGPENSTQFTLPNLLARFPVGYYPSALPVGALGGEYSHTITVAEMPTHSHSQNPHSHAVGNQSTILASPLPDPIPGAGVVPGTTAAATPAILNTGDSQPMPIVPPFLAIAPFIYAK